MEVVSYWETNLDVIGYWSARTDVHLEDAIFHLGRVIEADRYWLTACTVACGVLRNIVTEIENSKVMVNAMFTSMCDPKPGTYCDEILSGDPNAFIPEPSGDDATQYFPVPDEYED